MTTSYPRLLCYRTLLGPLLLWQGYRTRRHALRLPEAEGPRGGVEGQTDASPLRLLFVGDSSAAGVGVSHQNAALALPTAQTAAQRFYRRVHWQLFARSGLNTPEARAFLREAPIERADIVVTALGTNDVTSQHAPKSFRKHYRALLDELFERTGATSAIITGLPPLRILPAAPQPLRWYLGKYGARLDHELKSLCALDSRCAFLSLAWAAQPDAMAQDKFHPGPSQYAFWSRILCEHIGRFIGAFGDRRGRHEEPGDGA